MQVTENPTAIRRGRGQLFTAIGLIAAGTVVSFALSRLLWPDPPGAMTPSSALLPYFIGIGAVESIAFGAGLAFLVVGYDAMRRAPVAPWLAVAAYLSIAFMLLSWWPHDNMHRVLGHGDFAGLARIEYTFHLPLIVAAGFVALYLLRTTAALTGGSRARV
jgi:hypothetical protein